MTEGTQVPAAPPATEAPARATVLPGLALAAVAVVASYAVNAVVPVLSVLVVALALGALVANLGLVPPVLRPGLAIASRRLLRIGIVLLGLQLALREMLDLGGWTLVALALSVGLTFLGTLWIGRRLAVPARRTLLLATGFSICGAAAVAAMAAVEDADEEDVAASIAMVTLCGTAAILVLPLLQRPLGLDDAAFGVWSGASVHEVAQVVATAAAAGAGAIVPAVVVKLTRVVMLAPLIVVVALAVRRPRPTGTGRRPPLVPLFVLGFLAMVGVRSTGQVPDEALDVARHLTTALFAAALFALGTGVRVAHLVRTGGRTLVLGLGATVLVSLLGLAVTHVALSV